MKWQSWRRLLGLNEVFATFVAREKLISIKIRFQKIPRRESARVRTLRFQELPEKCKVLIRFEPLSLPQIGTFLHDSASFTCCRHHAWSECCRRRQTEVEEEIQQTAPSWENSIWRDFSPPAGKDSVSKRYYWKAFADWSERRRRIFRFISSSKDSIRKSFFLGFLLADILADEEQKEVKTSKTTSSFCVRILLLFPLFLGHDFASDKNFLISS